VGEMRPIPVMTTRRFSENGRGLSGFTGCNLAWRPLQRTASEEMNVKVGYGLAGVLSVIDDEAKAGVGDA